MTLATFALCVCHFLIILLVVWLVRVLFFLIEVALSDVLLLVINLVLLVNVPFTKVDFLSFIIFLAFHLFFLLFFHVFHIFVPKLVVEQVINVVMFVFFIFFIVFLFLVPFIVHFSVEVIFHLEIVIVLAMADFLFFGLIFF